MFVVMKIIILLFSFVLCVCIGSLFGEDGVTIGAVAGIWIGIVLIVRIMDSLEPSR